jgi:hypothetical protein
MISPIPASNIKINDDALWLVLPDPLTKTVCFNSIIGSQYDVLQDRLCDTCHGDGLETKKVFDWESGQFVTARKTPCPDCDGTGRYKFILDVQEPCRCSAECGDIESYSVHVVEVLGLLVAGQFVEESDWWFEEPNVLRHFSDESNDVYLPTATVPGMYVIKLSIHKAKSLV